VNLFFRNNKKIAAACWLMLMLIVHGVKLLHNHANRIDLLNCHAENNAVHTCATISEDHGEKDCSVCEYKLATDTDHFNFNFFLNPSFTDSQNCSTESVPFYTYIANAANKGPPARA